MAHSDRYNGYVSNHVNGCPVPQGGTGRYKLKGNVNGARLKLAATNSKSAPGCVVPQDVRSRGAPLAAADVHTTACTNVQLSSSGNRARGTRGAKLGASYNSNSDPRRPLGTWDIL